MPLTGETKGQHAYQVAKFNLHPQTDNLYVVFKDGWHETEVAEEGDGRRVAVVEEERHGGVPQPDARRRSSISSATSRFRGSVRRSVSNCASGAMVIDSFAPSARSTGAEEGRSRPRLQLGGRGDRGE